MPEKEDEESEPADDLRTTFQTQNRSLQKSNRELNTFTKELVIMGGCYLKDAYEQPRLLPFWPFPSSSHILHLCTVK